VWTRAKEWNMTISGRRLALRAVTVLAAVALAAPLGASAASATQPGQNGAIAFVRDGNIWVLDSAQPGADQRQLTAGGEAMYPRWSPDGRHIAYIQNGDIHVIAADGTGVRRLTTNGRTFSSAWTPDGRVVFQGSKDGEHAVFTIALDGSPAEQLTWPDPWAERPAAEPAAATPHAIRQLAARTAEDEVEDGEGYLWRNEHSLDMSADGTKLALSWGNDDDCGPLTECLNVIDLKTGYPKVVAGDRGGIIAMARFSPDSSRLVYTNMDSDYWDDDVEPVEVRSVDYAGEPGPKTTRISTPGQWAGSLSPDGARTVNVGRHGGVPTLYFGDAQGNGQVRSVPGDQPDWQPLPR
jgi:Tol biopolymer transport system component